MSVFRPSVLLIVLPIRIDTYYVYLSAVYYLGKSTSREYTYFFCLSTVCTPANSTSEGEYLLRHI